MEQKSPPRLVAPTTLDECEIIVVSFTRSNDNILELHKKCTTWQPCFRTWKLVLGLLPPIIRWFWLLATILQLILQNIQQENLKLIFSTEF